MSNTSPSRAGPSSPSRRSNESSKKKPYPSPRPSPSPQISPTSLSPLPPALEPESSSSSRSATPSFFPPIRSQSSRSHLTPLPSDPPRRPKLTPKPSHIAFPSSSPGLSRGTPFSTPLSTPFLSSSTSFPSSLHYEQSRPPHYDASLSPPSSPRSRSRSRSSSTSSSSMFPSQSQLEGDHLTSTAGPSRSSSHRPRPTPAVYSSLPSSPTRAFLDLDPLSPPPPLDLDLADALLLNGGKGRERASSIDALSPVVDDIRAREESKKGVSKNREPETQTRNPNSLWEYLQEEIWANEFDAHQEMKWERVSNFLSVPLAIEKIILFGCAVCLDSFLYTFTILPIRSFIAFFVVLRNYWTSIIRRKPRRRVAPSQKIDMLKFCLLLCSCVILIWGTDASYMYHSIRGQDSIKLVVIFNAFEIADRLCGAFGQDVLDSLFARETLSRRPNGSQPHMRPVVYFLLSLGYVLAHALVYFYQLISLNVAINSYDNALLTLLLSNQFVEIKGSVFKKFEKQNLFQIACADIVERFQLGLMLAVIALRNLIEMSGSDFAFLPKSFIRGKGNFETILSPALVVLGSEMAVDWVKHAYITKFNHIRASVYQRFTDVLCRDLVTAGAGGQPTRKKHLFADQSPLVSRRLGFAPLPLACLVIRVGMQAIGMASRRVEESSFSPLRGNEEISLVDVDPWLVAAKWAGLGLGGLVCWSCLVAFKIILGISLLNFASRRHAGMEERKNEDDDLNSFTRAPLGEGQQEKLYNKQLSALLDNPSDSVPFIPEIPVPAAKVQAKPEPSSTKKQKKVLEVEEVTRWTMIKTIF